MLIFRRVVLVSSILVSVAHSLKACSRAIALNQMAAAAAATVIVPEASSADVPIDPFNSMCLGFGCNSVQNLDSPLSSGSMKPSDEDSIAWLSFLTLVDKGKVARVEFDDVNMTKAWAVLKGEDSSDAPIRIGEGYPIEAGNSWSSTLFVARILQNAQIKYTYRTALKRK